MEFAGWRYSLSCWYFRPSFANYCPSVLLSGSTSPLPKVKVQYIKTVCGWEGWGVCYVVLETIFCRSLTLCFWPDYKISTLNKNLGGEGPQAEKHLRQSPFSGQFFRWRHLALLSVSLIFLRSLPSCNHHHYSTSSSMHCKPKMYFSHFLTYCPLNNNVLKRLSRLRDIIFFPSLCFKTNNFASNFGFCFRYFETNICL
jgi:hypothetical protein